MLEQADIDKIVTALSGQHIDKELDEQEEAPDWAKVSEALVILAGAVSELWEKVEEVESCVKQDLIGGLNGLVTKRKKMAFMDSFKGSHPEFGRFEQIVRDLAGKDVYEEVGNSLFDYQNSEDYSEEGLNEKIKQMIEEFENRFGKYAPTVEKTEEKEEPEAIAVEKTKVSSKVDPDLADFLKKNKGRL